MSKLKEGKLYIYGDGLFVCSSCAGFTAKVTGVGIDGFKLIGMSRGDSEFYERQTGKKPSCKCGKVSA